jgi:hypothetical protein
VNLETLRQDLLPLWPTTTRLFRIRPWECDRLSADEWRVYLAEVDRLREVDEEQRRLAKQLAELDQIRAGLRR